MNLDHPDHITLQVSKAQSKSVKRIIIRIGLARQNSCDTKEMLAHEIHSHSAFQMDEIY